MLITSQKAITLARSLASFLDVCASESRSLTSLAFADASNRNPNQPPVISKQAIRRQDTAKKQQNSKQQAARREARW